MNLKEYTQVFEKYKSRFIRFATSYLGDASSAEDVVMEAFMGLWNRRDTLSPEESPAYVLTIIKNKCLNILRDTKTHQTIESNIASQNQRITELRVSSLKACDPQELLDAELKKMVGDALKKLPKKTRSIFLRSRYKEESYREISAAMGCTIKNVEYEISKALKLLRRELKDYLPSIFFGFF
ncbi:MAG: RNA polymerase sigma-70 factor [Bacteroidaceae bacterium]